MTSPIDRNPKRTFCFQVFPGRFAICKLPPTAEIPRLSPDSFWSVTRTDREISIVCSEDSVPVDARSQGPLRCLRIVGPLDFDAIGIIADISSLVAQSQVSVLTLSTYDTDYFLIREDDLDGVVELLSEAGHQLATL